jgi:hypothetical protein
MSVGIEKKITFGVLLCGWGLAWASVETMPPNLLSLPWVQVLVGVLIASWGGATATLGRYLTATYDSRPFHWRLEAVRDGCVSITVGAGSYFGGAWYGLSPMVLGLVLLLAGYLGVRILSGAADRLLSLIVKP